MSVISHTWELLQEDTLRRERKHCKMCGKNTIFTDTNIRRHNSNGKNVYRYAIYKCEQNHTWNKKLAIYKTYHEHAKVIGKEAAEQKNSLTDIFVNKYKSEGISEIHIFIKHVASLYRLDSLLSKQIPEWSRRLISDKIREGTILLNGIKVKPSSKLAANDKIVILI